MTIFLCWLFMIAYHLNIGLALSEELSWIDSASNCVLANSTEVNNFDKVFPESWIGGFYETTPWFEYLGCFVKQIHFEPQIHWKEVILETNNPGLCYSVCGDSSYCGLQNRACICGNTTVGFVQAEPGTCDTICPGDKSLTCGGSNYYELYSNTEKTIEGVEDQQLLCSMQRYNHEANYSVLHAVRCDTKRKALCSTIIIDTYYVLPQNRTYHNATKMCTIGVLESENVFWNSIQADDEYWTNVRRFTYLRWLNNNTDIDTLNAQMTGKSNTECRAAKRLQLSHKATEIMLPCNNRLPFICNDGSQLENVSFMIEDYNTSTSSEVALNESTTEPFIFVKSTDTTIFIYLILFAGTLSICVISLAAYAIFIRFHKRKYYSFIEPNGSGIRKWGDVYFSTETLDREVNKKTNENAYEPTPLQVLSIIKEENVYNEPWTSKPEVNPKQQSKENYDHLNFTKQQTPTPTFIDGNEYGVPTCTAIKPGERNVDSGNGIYEQPWDDQESRLNRVVSRVRNGFVQRSRRIRSSIAARKSFRGSLRNAKCNSDCESDVKTCPPNENETDVRTIANRRSVKDRFQQVFSFQSFR